MKYEAVSVELAGRDRTASGLDTMVRSGGHNMMQYVEFEGHFEF